ncbi:MAG: hypothetical protein ACR2FU_12640 [Streptosporangiaceae bacterium]
MDYAVELGLRDANPFFRLMYYAGLRPEEAVNLSAGDVSLPASGSDEEKA